MSENSQTQASAKTWNDVRIEVIIGTLLRTGVILAASVVLIGGVLYLVRHGHELPEYRTFHGEPENLKTLSGIFHGVADAQRARHHSAWAAAADCDAGGARGFLCHRVRAGARLPVCCHHADRAGRAVV